MTYPRQYPLADGSGNPVDERDYNAIVGLCNGKLANGTYIQSHFDYIIRESGGYYEAIDDNGNLVYGGSGSEGGADGTDICSILQAIHDAVETAGTAALVHITTGTFSAKTTATLRTEGFRVYGAGGWGDFHLTADSNAGEAVYPRNATVILDDTLAGLDPVIQVGDDEATTIVKGVQLGKFAILGKEEPYASDTDWQSGAGIKVYSARTGCIFEQIDVHRKENGIEFTRKSFPYSYLHNNEGMIVRDLHFSYCDFGLLASDSCNLFDSLFDNVRGYYCYRGLIGFYFVSVHSHVSYRNIVGQMCGYEAASAGVSLSVSGEVTLDNVWIDNNHGYNAGEPQWDGLYGIYIHFTDPQLYTRGVVTIHNPTVHGTDYGITVDGTQNGLVNIYNPYLGLWPVSGLSTGAAEAGTNATTTVCSAFVGAGDDAYNGLYIKYTSGAAEDEVAEITDFTSASGTFTTEEFDHAPSAADTFKLITQSPLDGGFGLQSQVVFNNDALAEVNVYGGMVNTDLANKHYWFVGCNRVRDVKNFNPFTITAPFDSDEDTVGLEGGLTLPSSAEVCTVNGADIFIKVSGGTVSDITVYMPDDTVWVTGVTSGEWFLPVGWKIKITYSADPTVSVVTA